MVIIFCFDDIIVEIKELPNPEREMIKEVITLCKLILVNPATSGAGERSFSTNPTVYVDAEVQTDLTASEIEVSSLASSWTFTDKSKSSSRRLFATLIVSTF